MLEIVSNFVQQTPHLQILLLIYNINMNIELNKNNNVDKTGQFQINFEANNKEEDSFKKERSEIAQKYGRHEVPSVLNSPQKILNLKGFATLRVAQKVRFELQ